MAAAVTVGLIAHLVAKPGKEEEVAAFLAGALPLAQAEAFTPVWFAFRASKDQFYIVDAFPDAEGPKQHLAGPIAAALMARADELFAVPPKIENLAVLGAKLPGLAPPADCRACGVLAAHPWETLRVRAARGDDRRWVTGRTTQPAAPQSARPVSAACSISR